MRKNWTPAPDIVGTFSTADITYAVLLPDTNYPSGGYPVTPKTFGLGTQILAFVPAAAKIGPSAYLPVYDPVSGSLRIILTVAGQWTEVLSGTDLSTVTLDTAVLGW